MREGDELDRGDSLYFNCHMSVTPVEENWPLMLLANWNNYLHVSPTSARTTYKSTGAF